MITANLNTMSNNEILESGGMIHISASNSGEKLSLEKGKEIIIQMATKDTLRGMQTFISENNGNEMNWTLPKPNHIDTINNKKSKKSDREPIMHILRRIFSSKSTNDVITDYDPYEGVSDKAIQNQLGNLDNIIIKSNQLGWINCDRFPNIKNKTNIIVSIDTLYWPVVRLVFKDINSIMPGNYDRNKNIIFSNIPIGYNLTLIAFSLINNEPYFTSKEIKVTKDLKVKLDLTKTTLFNLEEELKKLDK